MPMAQRAGRDLAVEALRKRFGGVPAVDGVSFTVPGGAILGVIGPNGSGKTTTLNLLGGVYRPDGGSIRIGGRELTGRSSLRYSRLGISRTFQNPRVFTTISVLDNMLIPVLHARGRRAGYRARAMELLDLVGLAAHRDTAASELSGGQQKLVEFARALMTDPAVVLMDEPFAGVHPSVKQVMRAQIRRRNERGTAFMIVSHEIPDLMRLSQRVICMSAGTVISHGTPGEVSGDPAVIEAYLGRSGGAR